MTAPHARFSPESGRRPRHSDVHAMLLDHVRFHGVLAELARLWGGTPLGRQHGRRTFQYVMGVDGALHDYALNLSRCFPEEPHGGHRR